MSHMKKSINLDKNFKRNNSNTEKNLLINCENASQNFVRKSANSHFSNLKQSLIEKNNSNYTNNTGKLNNVLELVKKAQKQNENLRKEALKYLND